jgi:hypothetical protein
MNQIVSKMGQPEQFISAAELLRAVVAMCDFCNESLWDRYSVKQIVAIYAAYDQCGWDFAPDQWTTKQLREALQGIAPDWDRTEAPLYSDDRKETRRVQPYTFQAAKKSVR